MTILETYDHRGATAIIENDESFTQFFKHIQSFDFEFKRGTAGDFSSWLDAEFKSLGWAHPVRVSPTFKPTINACHHSIAFTAQTGNIARAFYDLLKFQSLFLNSRISAACLLVPCKPAAKRLGQNVANFDRVQIELANIYNEVVLVPTLLVSMGF